jgi:hypothetical protein
MKKSIVLILALIVVVIISPSCSMEKRHYRSGYNIEWKKRNSELLSNEKKEIKGVKEPQVKNNEIKPIEPKEFSASSNEDIILPKGKSNNEIINSDGKERGQKQEALNPKNNFRKGFNEAMKTFIPLVDGPKSQGMAVASLVMGILALLTYYGAFLFGLLALIFGLIALKRIRTSPDKFEGKGMAKAGIIMGIIAMVVIIILIGALA